MDSKSSFLRLETNATAIHTDCTRAPSCRSPARNPASRHQKSTNRQNRRRCATWGHRRQDTVGTRTSTVAAAAATSPALTPRVRAGQEEHPVRGGTWRTLCATRCVRHPPVPPPAVLTMRAILAVWREGPLCESLSQSFTQAIQTAIMTLDNLFAPSLPPGPWSWRDSVPRRIFSRVCPFLSLLPLELPVLYLPA